MLRFLDYYTLRARLFPALIGVAPALAAFFLLISWRELALSNIAATVGLLVLVFALADLARRQGLKMENELFKLTGGKPSIVMFRRNDTTFDEVTKDRYRTFIGGKIPRKVPTATEEQSDQRSADEFYEACGIWLRTNTRDTKRFPILFGELITYGFRRNLLGLKWIGLALNASVLVIVAAILWSQGGLSLASDLDDRQLVVLCVSAIHAAYLLLAVTRDGVVEASRRYARELILSTEMLMIPAKRKVAAKNAT
ncbi:hypothetical protein ACC684_24830 [Rhizobium ruizarguesonis]